MIVTLTPNPSVDRTIEIAGLVRGEVLRATANRVDPGGKGVNVSRALAAAGLPTVAVLPSGGVEGTQLAALLAPEGVSVAPVTIRDSVRSNVSLVEPDGIVTKVNEAGPTLSPSEVEALQRAVLDLAERATWVVCSGSLPQGVPDALYADLVRRARTAGARVAVDASGAAFAAAVAEIPDLVKPNHEELAELTGHPLPTLGDVLDAAKALVLRGIGVVLVSLGARGALLVQDGIALHARAAVDVPRSNVGAGDSTLAGYLAGEPEPTSALTRAVAYGAAAVSLPGSVVPGPGDLRLDRVALTDRLDHDLKLIDPPTGDDLS